MGINTNNEQNRVGREYQGCEVAVSAVSFLVVIPFLALCLALAHCSVQAELYMPPSF